MTPITAFHPYVTPLAPGLPDFAIDRALLDAAIDLCRSTHVWQVALDPVLLIPGQREYELYADGGSVSTVLEVVLDGRKLDRATHGTFPTADDAGTPDTYLHRAPDILEVAPVPVNAAALTLRAALEPAHNDTQLADELFREWREVIGAGASARLLLYHGDARQAAVMQSVFDGGLRRARAQATVSRSRGVLRTLPCP